MLDPHTSAAIKAAISDDVEAAIAATAAAAARLSKPRIVTRDDALKHPPTPLDGFRTPTLRAPIDCAPAIWYWQMTGLNWDRQTRSYKAAKKQHERFAASDAQIQREAERDRKRDRSQRERTDEERQRESERDRSLRERRADDYIRRREQLTAQKARELEEDAALEADYTWRADAPRRARRGLLAALLDAAGLDNAKLLEPCEPPFCRGGQGWPLCVHSFLDVDKASLEMDDPAFVEDLVVCCDKYIEFLEARTSLRYEEWHSLMLRTRKVESLFPVYTEPDNTLEEEDGHDEAAALEMRIDRVLRRPFRLRALSSYYRVGRPVDDDFRTAMVNAIRSQPPLNAAEVRTLISVCDLWLLIDDVKYAESEKMLEKLSDDELETWFDSHRSHVCEEVRLKMQRMRDLGEFRK